MLEECFEIICGGVKDSDEFYFEAVIRNTGSIKLLRKFGDKYEIIEQGFERSTTDSGKDLEMQGHILKTK